MQASQQRLGPPQRGAALLPCLPSRPGWHGRRANRTIVCAAAPVDTAQSSFKVRFEEEDAKLKAFPYPLPMDPAQQTLSSIPLALFYPAMVAAIGATGYIGSLLGRAAPVEPENKPMAATAMAVVVGGAAAYGAVLAKKKRDSAAVVDLYNTLVDMDDPSNLSSAVVESVGSKYGINMQRDELDGVKKIYGQFLETIIPVGDNQLRGDEADKVRSFKEALGLTDEDAAPVHIEVARRLFRASSETKDRQSQFEQRKAFQRLIYVSQIVFGDQKAAFLLPWRRTFNLTESQIFVARRDNAKAIFKNHLEAQGGHLVAERHFLHELRDYQARIKMMDESAEEVVKDYARRHIEARLLRAIEANKAVGKTKDVATVVLELQQVLDYGRKLVKYANEEDLIPGLGQITILGGPLADPSKSRDIKELYKVYLDEQLSALGEFTPELEADARDLQKVLCLPAKEAGMLQDEVAAKLYKKLLREEVTSKRIDAAPSPAAVLQTLCERVKFSPEAALELHKSLYKQKMLTLIDKKRLTDEDAEDLKRIRRILCISGEAAKKVMRDTTGKVLEEAISDVFMLGAKPVSDMELQKLDAIMADLRIEPDVALQVLEQVTRERLRSYVQAAQKERGDRKAAAAIMKKLVQFNALVVTPLLERIKGLDAAKKELADLLIKASEDAQKEGALPSAEAAQDRSKEETVKQVAKAIQANRGEFGEDERKGQKEITLKDDLEPAVRADIYKTYLMYTMSGDVVELPVGGAIRKKANMQTRNAEMARLSQLGDLLGMSQVEVASAHNDLAEQAFKAQATEIFKSGPMSEEKMQYLDEMRTQLGISKEAGDKLIKGVKSEIYGNSAALEDGGRWTLERVMEVTKAGGSVEGMMEEISRRNLFRKEFEKRISDGTGDFDAEFMLKQLPLDILSLEERKVRMIVKELVATRKRMLLVQAVSQYRQKRLNETARSLYNLVSCSKAMPEDTPMVWNEKQELKDVFAVFCSKEADESKRSLLQRVLGLSDAEATEISTASETITVKAKEDDDSFF